MSIEAMLLLASAKTALLVGAALLLVSCARRASAAIRHALLLATITGVFLLPMLHSILPTLSPLSFPSRSISAIPELQRFADEAFLLLLIRSDGASDVPVRSLQSPGRGTIRAVILIVWLSGTAAVLCRIVSDLVAARRVRSRATKRGRIGRGVPVLESTEIGTPVAVGLVRPAILIPAGEALGPASLPFVLAHELAHVERRDCLTQLVARLACALYWFNPLVWFASRRIVLEQERACDDRALASGVDPIRYSQTLIDLARQRERSKLLLRGMPSMARPEHLERRIVGILDESAARGALSRWSIVVLLMGCSCVVAPLASFGFQDRPSLAAMSDPFLDPQTERVDGVRELDPQTERVDGIRQHDRTAACNDSTTIDGALIATLRCAAAREPEGPYDLVPDRARWALSQVRGGRIVEPLLDALRHSDWRIRGYAAWALALAGDPRAVESLLPLLDDPVWRLRAMAASALRKIADARAANALAAALDDPAWQVRVEAVAYFGALRERQFEPRLAALRNDPHIAVRLAADEALSALE